MYSIHVSHHGFAVDIRMQSGSILRRSNFEQESVASWSVAVTGIGGGLTGTHEEGLKIVVTRTRQA